MVLVRIAWKSGATHLSGHGQWFEKGRYGIELLIAPLNRQYPDLHHQIEYWTRRMN